MNDISDYPSFLDAHIRSEGPKRKGKRTRDKLKIAASKLLNEVAYQDLRVTDICEKAGVSPGTFYLYFDNKKVLAIEVLSEFAKMFDRYMHADPDSPFNSIFHSNLAFIKICRANSGLTRCITQVSDSEREFARIQQRINDRWFAKVAASISHWLSEEGQESVLLTIHALGSMMDDFAHRIFVAQDPYLLGIIEDLNFADEKLAKHLSIIWYRAIFGNDPPEEDTNLIKPFSKRKSLPK